MSPNPFTLVKLAFSPHRWNKNSRSSSQQSVKPREQWDLPVKGIYEYKPGRGWYLVEYVEDAEPSSSSIASTASVKASKAERLPRHCTYAKVQGRMMFTSDYEKRRHFEYVKTGDNYQVEQCGFFRMDDGTTYVCIIICSNCFSDANGLVQVKCWDNFGHFIPGPYQQWCIDDKTKRMRPMVKSDAILNGQTVDGLESRRDSWENMQQQPSMPEASRQCSACSSPSVRSLRRPTYDMRASQSTFAESSTSQGTAMTTPSSGVVSREQTKEDVDAKALRAELMKIDDS